MTYLREASKGSKFATSAGWFTVISYDPVLDRVRIVWDRWPDEICYMSGNALTSYMARA